MPDKKKALALIRAGGHRAQEIAMLSGSTQLDVLRWARQLGLPLRPGDSATPMGPRRAAAERAEPVARDPERERAVAAASEALERVQREAPVRRIRRRPLRPPELPVPEDVRVDLLRRLAAGQSSRQICVEMGVGLARLRRLARSWDIHLTGAWERQIQAKTPAILRLLQEGATSVDIGRRLRVNPARVRQMARDHGFVLRQGLRRGHKGPYTERSRAIVEALRAGARPCEVARQFGVSRNAVADLRRRYLSPAPGAAPEPPRAPVPPRRCDAEGGESKISCPQECGGSGAPC